MPEHANGTSLPGEILVTGGAGFVGRHTALAAVDAGWRVTTLDVRPVAEDVLLGCRVLDTDQTDPSVLREIRAGRFAAVIHQAGISSTTEQDEELLGRVNVDGPSAIARACRAAGTRFIYASSHSVYGTIPAGVLVSECDVPGRCSGPLNKYAEAKLRLDREMAATAGDLTWFGLRYTNVFGGGEEHKETMASIISQVLRQAAQGIPVRLFSDALEASRDYVPVAEVARACLELVRAPARPGVYNVGSGAPISFATLLQWCTELVDGPVAVTVVPNPFVDRYQYWTGADTTKLYRAIPEPADTGIRAVRRAAAALFQDFRAGRA